MIIGALKWLVDHRSRISTQMYLGIGGAVALTLSASLVAWFSFNRIGDATDRVSEGSVPEMVASFGIAQVTGILAAAAPRLTSAATTGEFNEISAEVAQANTLFERQLATLTPAADRGARIANIHQFADRLSLNIEDIKLQKGELLNLEDRSTAISGELVLLETRLDEILVPAIDGQLFYTVTGYRELGEPPDDASQHFSESEFNRYRHIAELAAEAHIAIQLLASAFTVSEAAYVEPLRERFEAATGRIERNLAALEGTSYAFDTAPIFTHLIDTALRDDGGFDLLARKLELENRQRALVELNREVAVELVEEVNGMVNEAERKADLASDASSQSILTARYLLLAIMAVSVSGALLIAWLLVGRVILQRLQRLSNRMRNMAAGDL